MQTNNRHYLIAVVILLVTFLSVFGLEKANSLSFSSKDFSNFPMEIGQWRGRDIVLSKKVYEILKTDDVLAREYKDGQGNSITFTVVYSENDRAAFHPPELCYLGGGIELITKEIETIPLAGHDNFRVKTLTMQNKKGSILKAWYWFATRSRFTHSFYIQQLNILFDWLRHNTKEGALIRVSAHLPNSDSPASEKRIKAFIQSVMPLIEKFLKKT